MPKRKIDTTRDQAVADRPPVGLTRRQRRAWNDDLLRRRRAETDAVLEAATLAVLVMGPAVEPEAPRPGRVRRAWSALWERRALLFTLGLMSGMLVIVISTQVAYYRPMAGLTPEFGSAGWLRVRVYLTVPVITELLSMNMAVLAGYVIDKNKGRYRLYIRFMWIFAGIGAAVNLRGGWEHVGDNTHMTALVLAGMSLCVPLIWHMYTGMRIAIEVSGRTIAEIARVGRQWTRHPVLSFKTARAVELFPEMTRDDVWEKVAHRARYKREQKWNEIDTSAHPRKQLAAALRVLARVRTPRDLLARWSDKPAPAGGDTPVNEPCTVDDDRAPGGTSGVNTLLVDPPTPAETTGEIKVRDLVVRAWFEVHGEHLPVKGEQPWGYQAKLAAQVGRSKSYVTKVFNECRNGVHSNPFLNVNEQNKE